jgi:hypothetical protein
MMAFQADQKAKDPKFTMIPDSVHPSPQGHIMMARYMLTAFAEPMPPMGTVDLATNSAQDVEIISKSDTQVELKATLKQFPFWIDNGSLAVAKDCGMLDFATPKLYVKGLPEGSYAVLVDGKTVDGSTDAQALAAGIALPSVSPYGKLLHDLIAAKESSYFNTWRNIRLQISDAAYRDPIVAALMSVDENYHKAIWAMLAQSPEIKISIVNKPEGGNLAVNCKYDCTDPNKYNWGIGGLTDGSWVAGSKNCFATGDNAKFPKDVTIDLEKLAEINSINIGVPAFGSTKTIKVSVSEDNATFTEVGEYEFTFKKEERHTFSIKPVKARYVRLTYVENYKENGGYSPNFAFTTECEVYGKVVK